MKLWKFKMWEKLEIILFTALYIHNNGRNSKLIWYNKYTFDTDINIYLIYYLIEETLLLTILTCCLKLYTSCL